MAKLKSANTISATATLSLRSTEALFFVTEALYQACDQIIASDTVATARELCPVLDKATKERWPGELRDTIEGRVKRVKKGVSARVFTKSGYGGFVELGTTKMAAQPYIYPAFEQNIQRLPDAVTENLRGVVSGGAGGSGTVETETIDG